MSRGWVDTRRCERDLRKRDIPPFPVNRGHRRPRSRLPGRPDPARPAKRPDGADPGGRTVRAHRRRALHSVAAEGDPARRRLHPDRERRRPRRYSSSRWPLDRPPLPLETSSPGVFAIGDVRYRSIKRVASAVGDGAAAVRIVHEYLATGRRQVPPPGNAGNSSRKLVPAGAGDGEDGSHEPCFARFPSPAPGAG